MAKTKTPFYSLGAKGTIGDALTSQKFGKDTLFRKKPIPTDPYSLNQAYQRWDYRDYAYLWTLLSNSEKQVYRTAASRYHITGFSQFMRENLKTLPDIMGRWRLDNTGDTIAPDSSKNTNHGIIFGASMTTGIISHGRRFDGINDLINCGNDPSLNLGIDDFAFDFFFKTSDSDQDLCGKWQDINNRWYLGTTLGGQLRMYAKVLGGVVVQTEGLTYVADNLWHHGVILGHRAVRAYVFIDGLDDTGIPRTCLATNMDNTADFLLARGNPAFQMECDIDHLALYSRLLDPTEILRHSQRRYPVK